MMIFICGIFKLTIFLQGSNCNCATAVNALVIIVNFNFQLLLHAFYINSN